MKNFRLLEKNIDVKPFLSEIAQNEEFWSTARAQLFKAHRETMNINLRRAVKKADKPLIDSHTIENTELYELFPYTTSWVEKFSRDVGELARLMVVSLQPEGKVYAHFDAGEYYEIRDRYHLVLQSRGGSKMTSGDEEQIFREGELWWFDNKKMHQVVNQSIYPRIHVIFDVRPKGVLA